MSDLARALLDVLDPSALMARAGLIPDAWQTRVLRARAPRVLMLCSRQSGKSTVASCAALHEVMYSPGSLVLLLSPSLRQSGELFRRVLDLLRTLGTAAPALDQQSALRLEFANKSRIVSLLGQEDATVRRVFERGVGRGR